MDDIFKLEEPLSDPNLMKEELFSPLLMIEILHYLIYQSSRNYGSTW